MDSFEAGEEVIRGKVGHSWWWCRGDVEESDGTCMNLPTANMVRAWFVIVLSLGGEVDGDLIQEQMVSPGQMLPR